jgi:hypothetical protein
MFPVTGDFSHFKYQYFCGTFWKRRNLYPYTIIPLTDTGWLFRASQGSGSERATKHVSELNALKAFSAGPNVTNLFLPMY